MGQILHGCATTTEAVRRAIQHSQESLATAMYSGVGVWQAVADVTQSAVGVVSPITGGRAGIESGPGC